MDADLQHPPEVIPSLLEQARRTGAEIVVASRYA
jgi:dolichol-phosphate mannosyltransferase